MSRQQALEAELAVARADLREAGAVLEAVGWLADVTRARRRTPLTLDGE
jgi:DNA-binding FadR family transcriptional regulator